MHTPLIIPVAIQKF